MAPSAIDVVAPPLTEPTPEKGQHHQAPKVDSFDAKTANTDELARALIRNGCFYLRNFVDQETLTQITTDIRPYFEQDPPWHASGVCFPPQTKRVSGLAAKSDTYRNAVLMNPTWLALSERLLATSTAAWFGDIKAESTSHPILGGTVCFQIKAGAAAQGLHRDNMGYHHTDPRITADQWHVGRDSGIALFLAGTRTTKENGATRFVPGSHLQASAEGPGNEDEAVYAEMEKGDCLVMFTSLYHAGSPNLTEDEERLVYTNFSIRGTLRGVSVFFFFFKFSPSPNTPTPNHIALLLFFFFFFFFSFLPLIYTLRTQQQQMENQYISIPPTQAASWSDEVLSVIGYAVSHPFLGVVDFMDPMTVIRGQKEGRRYDIKDSKVLEEGN